MAQASKSAASDSTASTPAASTTDRSNPDRTVLLVDDEPGILTALSGILEDEGFATVCTSSAAEALELYQAEAPDVVFLDIWLADRDGLQTLQALRAADPAAAVVMMSGHGTPSTAVKAIKMGAFDYLEKPLSYNRVMEAVGEALAYRRGVTGNGDGAVRGLEQLREAEEGRAWADLERLLEQELEPPRALPLLRESDHPQRTLGRSTVLYGLGLHSGGRTGMAIQPLPPDSGIHFLTVPGHHLIPAHVDRVADTDYATTLSSEGEHIRTVEHLLSALHAAGITNLLIRVHGEIPVLDGSALEFCKTFREIGMVEQDAPRKELVIDRPYRVGDGDASGDGGSGGGKELLIEPHDGFAVSYHLDYPQPVGQQDHHFELTGFDSYVDEIAPARTFGFMKDLKMINELGLGSGGRLDNFILVGEDEVLNTELRFPDEFVRHKILDVIGDLYLLGYPVRGKVTARLTGHRDNIAILQEIDRGSAAG